MITRQLLGTAQIPGQIPGQFPGGEDLRLFAHGRDFMIVMGHNELMNTRLRGSEEALATMALDRLKGRKNPHLLIGGYGMGFTLRAALAALGSDGRITVAELVPEIIEWAEGPMAALTDGCLDDPRVTLRHGDVADAIADQDFLYDAILLDVDNGPDGLVRPENNRIYSNRGLQIAMRALTPGGVLAVWSAGPDRAFTRRLTDAGFAVEEVTVHARIDANGKGKGPKHVIWFARGGA